MPSVDASLLYAIALTKYHASSMQRGENPNPVSQSQHERENNLLLSGLRPRPTPLDLTRTRELLLNDLDWEYLFNFAERQALAPFLYHQLNKIGADVVPRDYWQRLKTSYQANVARSIVLTDELLSVARELRAIGVESLPFKGPVLGVVAYGNSALRCFIDLDIIVRPSDVSATTEVLLARGYRTSKRLDTRQKELLITAQHNIEFEQERGQLLVELHWRVSADLFAAAFRGEELWGRLETITINDVELKSLPIEELLFALCIHGSRHVWDRFSQICDIAALISGERRIDWNRLMALATKTRTERMLLLGLCLAGKLAEESVPPDIKDLISSDQQINRLADLVMQRLFSGAAGVKLSPKEVFTYNMLVRRSWTARARYCLFALSPADSDLETFALPRFLNFAYYGLRPLRLMRSAYRGQNRAGKVLK